MKSILKFLRTTLVGGLLFLVPIIAIAIILEKALLLTHKFVDPLAEHLPVPSLIGLRTPLFLAIGLIVLFCFLTGFIARTVLAQKLVRWLESAVLSNVPGYEFLKSIGESMLGAEKKVVHQPVLVQLEHAWQIGFAVERLENGLVAVFIPDAPNPHTGDVFFISPDRIQVVDVPAAGALKCVSRLGAGANALMRGLHLPAAATRITTD